MENYEKKYKEALEWMRDLYPTMEGMVKEDAEHHFPELKEPEGEQIRKALIKYYSFNKDGGSHALDNITPKQIVAWLESLKDRVHPKVELTQLDKNILEAAIAFAEYSNHFNCWRGVDKHTVLSALHSLRPQNNITDEELIKARNEAYNDALDKLEYHSDTPTFNDGWSAAIWYLKKRNAQPQPQWKPSDEQMTVLNDIIINGHLSNANERILKGLHEQLKKLREE